MLKLNNWLFLLAAVFVFSCGKKNTDPEQDRTPLARVGEKFLYSDELSDVVPPGVNSKDSIRIVRNFIDNWVQTNLLLQKAENNLAPEHKDFEKQIQDYRNSLIIYTFEKELVREKLDTVVSDQEIEKYYNENAQNFELKDNIIKVVYVKVRKEAPGIKKVQTLYKSEKPQDRKQLEEYCLQFAENYYLDDQTWLQFEDLLKEIPITAYNQELFLQNNRHIEVEDSTSYYFVNIKGFKIKDSQSPLSFEKENIRNIILNRRKLSLIDQMKDGLYNEALKNKEVEIFNE